MLDAKPLAFSILLASALAGTPAPAAADITIGTGKELNCIPFGCQRSGIGTVYQQIYAASGFTGRFRITGVQFQRGSSGGALNGGIYTLSVSTTSFTPGTIDTADFGVNIGADNVEVFNGTLAPNFAGDLLTFNFSTPYVYDPTRGSLLLNFDVGSLAPSSDEPFFRANNGTAGGAFSRAHNFGSGFIDFGLRTTFVGTSVVPEPETWAMMILGFGLVGSAMRRARRQVASVPA